MVVCNGDSARLGVKYYVASTTTQQAEHPTKSEVLKVSTQSIGTMEAPGNLGRVPIVP